MESLKVRDYMNARPVTFSPEASLSEALDKLLASRQTGGPVVNESGRVVGFLSEQDMIHKLLKVGYFCQETNLVSDCMQSDVLSVQSHDSIIELADKMVTAKPKLYPVVDDGVLIGTITRRDVLRAISTHLGDCFKHPV
ncbi:CBS domain-containing protein [Thaumasiovibrio subtropicus]|uniref:CBS domain-containing protein n=1 Tax=Thaumasiovibrio subtropicus TaxID=1891207 RepID=UPI000B351FE5|nr:CBS domain-containing protein [Thaumasiovibrio subtropicus]